MGAAALLLALFAAAETSTTAEARFDRAYAVAHLRLEALIKTQQDDVRERNRQIDEGVFTAINDPRRPLQAPKRETVPPALNFAPLENAVEMLTQAAARYQKAADAARGRIVSDSAKLRAVNAKLIQAEPAKSAGPKYIVEAIRGAKRSQEPVRSDGSEESVK